MKFKITLLCVRSFTPHTQAFRIVVFLFLLLTVWKANAQPEFKEIEKKYNVKIGTVLLKATPYMQLDIRNL
ncbi:MAG: hypothetical protein LC105_02045 [Chitinophagales bacterium]|nr:hypothetical protein [Chitinophagales bacterium]